ncbi:MAG: hypothetical protein PVH62_04590 [Anaerolineae bacterium]|jgi:hypothetical protein
MIKGDMRFVSAERARRLVEIAEQAKAQLSRLAGHDVAYDATALQLLDEWIERMAQRTPDPQRELRVLWIAFLGETFRRRHNGEWAVQERDGGTLVVLCPAEAGGLHAVEVAAQVQRRIANGFVDSLALFYAQESIVLKQRQVT